MTQKSGFVILLGPPGSGKGTQAKLLSDRHQGSQPWIHISTGDLFRKEIASGSQLGKTLQGILASGQLVSDDQTNDVFHSQVKVILNKNPACVLLLDGYPRTAVQAKFLRNLANSIPVLKEGIVVELRVPEDSLVERLTNRLVNPRTGGIYHKIFNPPKKPGICDVDGGPLIQRDDDKEETVRKRFAVYSMQRDAILEALKGLRHSIIEGTGAQADVCAKLEAEIAAI